MKEVSYEEGHALLATHVCSCGGELMLAWGGAWGIESYVLRCGRDPAHQGIVRRGNPTRARLAQRGLSEVEIEREMTPKEDNMVSKALAEYRGVTSLTQTQAAEIVSTLWPDAPAVEVLKAAIVCKQYGLNPLMKHLFLLKFWNKKDGRYDWAQVLGIGATRLIASRSRRYSYADGPRLMTPKEQEAIYGDIDPENLVAITILKDEKDNRAPGYGKWPRNETPYGADKGNTKANMAMIRSERAAFERLIPGEMPTLEVVSEEYTDREAEDRGAMIKDAKTGESLGGEAEALVEEANQGTPGGPPDAPKGPPPTKPLVQATAGASTQTGATQRRQVATPRPDFNVFWQEVGRIEVVPKFNPEQVLEILKVKGMLAWLEAGHTLEEALGVLRQKAKG